MHATLQSKEAYKDYVFTGTYKRDPNTKGLLTADGTPMTEQEAYDLYKRDSDGKPVREIAGRYKAFYMVGKETVAVIGTTDATLQAALKAQRPSVTEVRAAEPAFELVQKGQPYLDDGVTKQNYRVLRNGVAVATFVAEGTTSQEFNTDRDGQYAGLQTARLQWEADQATAASVAGV